MSLSKAAQRCEMCKQEKGIYSCPRCNLKYCSSHCYKSVKHEVCSESFYQEWVESSLRNKSFDVKGTKDMLQILKKSYEESLESDMTDVSSIADRFAGISVDEADEDVLWQKLNKEEKAQFQAFIKDESKLEQIVKLKQPWWTVSTLNLVSDLEKEEAEVEDAVSVRPVFPLNVKKLSSLTSRKPARCIQFNLVNMLYGYAFLYRFYNCDFKDFLEDVVEYFFTLCPALCSNKNYHSLEESVQDTIRLILSSNVNVSLDFIKSIVNDANNLLKGPINAKPSTFVICALNDIATLLLEAKRGKELSSDLKKQIMPAVKKIEYYMSWTLDFESNLSVMASDLMLLMIPDLITVPDNSPTEAPKNKTKPLIEEIS